MKSGEQIAGYTLAEQIAVGGFGTVWRARHKESGKVAAIKVLHAYLVSSEVLVKRFEREAKAIALMRHRNIVELYSAGRLADGRPYLIMELLDGRDLGLHIAQRGPLQPSECLEILTQLGSALGAAHAQNIIHRDLKASNVFLCQDGDALRVVLFDFGIAKLIGHDAASLTVSSALIGSPACMSPEQIRGLDVDVRTDVYGLGSLTYQMLVGHPPFSGASPTAILTMHLDDYPPYPSLHGDVSPVFDSVVMKALNKEPRDRYPSVAAFVDAFRSAVARGGQHSRKKPAERAKTSECSIPALGLFVDVSADPSALEEPEDTLLDDMESIIPRAAERLEDRGYLVAYERGTSALFIHSLPPEELSAPDTRRREILTLLDLFNELQARPQRDIHVRLRMFLHIAEVLIDGDEIESVGPLEAPDWTLIIDRSGVVADDTVLSGLGTISDLRRSSTVLHRLRDPLEQ